jgi:sulfide:quinone oxidoreductase
VPGLADAKGMILTNEFMQSPKYPDIFAVGVCAHLDSFETTPIPIGVPKTGYMNESMGTAVVQNI